MSKEIVFTDSQKLLIKHVGSTLVEACPGAGKTQTIAERFAVRPNTHPRKGVALLSFTNAAADEARVRCSRNPSLLAAPNFVGTIDKFLNRFIVSPVLTSKHGVRPHFVDTWSQLPNATVQSTGVKGIFSLDWFDFDLEGVSTLHGRNAPFMSKKSIRELSSAQRLRIQEEAVRVRKRFIDHGYYSAEASRQVALVILSDPPTRAKLTAILGNRFSEVIVDEVQDCSSSDVDLLLLLKEAGIMTVLVGDPDQAIYEFRQETGSPTVDVTTLAPAGRRLNGNFRSTPAICAIADSLRASNGLTDIPCGPNKDSNVPVYIFGYLDLKEIAPCIQLLMNSEGFEYSQTVVLSHGWSTARSVAGGSTSELNSNSKLVRIASTIRCLHEETDARLRQTALRSLANTLHEAAVKELRSLGLAEFLTEIGISEREFRTSVLRVAIATPYDSRPSVFKQGLVQSLSANSFDWVDRLTVPKGDKWPSLPSWRKASTLEYGTIHSYKGLQREFVTMVMPEDSASRAEEESGVTLWHENRDGEARRVLYVGATRAQKLLMLAVHDSHLDNVLDCVVRDSVPIRNIRVENAEIVDLY